MSNCLEYHVVCPGKDLIFFLFFGKKMLFIGTEDSLCLYYLILFPIPKFTLIFILFSLGTSWLVVQLLFTYNFHTTSWFIILLLQVCNTLHGSQQIGVTNAFLQKSKKSWNQTLVFCRAKSLIYIASFQPWFLQVLMILGSFIEQGIGPINQLDHRGL